MRKFLSAILLLSLLMMPTRAMGEDKRLIAPLRLGQPAPFDGILLSTPAAADWIGEMKAEKARSEALLQQQLELAEARRLSDLKIAEISSNLKFEACQVQVNGLKGDLAALQATTTTSTSPSSGSSPYFWAGLGAGGGILLTLATVFAVGLAKR